MRNNIIKILHELKLKFRSIQDENVETQYPDYIMKIQDITKIKTDTYDDIKDLMRGDSPYMIRRAVNGYIDQIITYKEIQDD